MVQCRTYCSGFSLYKISIGNLIEDFQSFFLFFFCLFGGHPSVRLPVQNMLNVNTGMIASMEKEKEKKNLKHSSPFPSPVYMILFGPFLIRISEHKSNSLKRWWIHWIAYAQSYPQQPQCYHPHPYNHRDSLLCTCVWCRSQIFTYYIY